MKATNRVRITLDFVIELDGVEPFESLPEDVVDIDIDDFIEGGLQATLLHPEKGERSVSMCGGGHMKIAAHLDEDIKKKVSRR